MFWGLPRLLNLLGVLVVFLACGMTTPRTLEWDLSKNRSIEKVDWQKHWSGDFPSSLFIERPTRLLLRLPEDQEVRGLFRFISVDKAGDEVENIVLKTPKTTALGACEHLKQLLGSLNLDDDARQSVAAWCADAEEKDRNAAPLTSGVACGDTPSLFIEVLPSYDLKREEDWVVVIHVGWFEPLLRP